MELLTRGQKQVLDKFVEHTRRLMRLGFQRSYTDENLLENLQCIESEIRRIQFSKTSRSRKCYNRQLEQEYIRYIIRLIRAGLKFVKNDPKYLDDINQVQNVLNDCKNLFPGRKRRPKSVREVITDDSDTFEEIYIQLSGLNRKIDKVQNKIYELENRSFATPKNISRTNDCMKRFLNEINNKLDEIGNDKKNRINENFDLTMPTLNLRSSADNYKEPTDSNDESPSEVLVSNETYVKAHQQPAKIGRIERNILIPVYVDDDDQVPNIKSRVYLEECTDGIMRINVVLEFDQEVMCNRKLVKEVKIRNLMTA